MERFESIQEYELMESVKSRRNLRLTISEEILGFKAQMPQVSFVEPREVPPPVMSLPTKLEIAVHTGIDQAGKYSRFVVAVYERGGKILYRSLPKNQYEAHIVWPEITSTLGASA